MKNKKPPNSVSGRSVVVSLYNTLYFITRTLYGRAIVKSSV